MMDKLLHLMQLKLGKLEAKELEEITRQSEDEAVRISLLLASQPASPMPHFIMDSKYSDPDNLADAITNKFEEQGEAEGKSFQDDFKQNSITDAEAIKLCEDWKSKYDVVVGVSWGSLPNDLQQKWMLYSCDYHLDIERSNIQRTDEQSSSEKNSNLVSETEYLETNNKDGDDILKSN